MDSRVVDALSSARFSDILCASPLVHNLEATSRRPAEHFTIVLSPEVPPDLLDLATLALLIRSAAERGASVAIRWKTQSRRRQGHNDHTLRNSGFTRLFQSAVHEQGWTRRVSVEELPHHQHSKTIPAPPIQQHLAMTWFDNSSFEYQGEPLFVRPTITSRIRSNIKWMFYNAGLEDDVLIDHIVDSAFYELAWNTIIHSTNDAASAKGLFAATLSRTEDGQSALIRLVFADAGYGIPVTLRAAFERATTSALFTEMSDRTKEENILHFAFTQGATRRPKHTSTTDRDAQRGLLSLAAGMKSAARMSLRSCGAQLNLSNDPLSNRLNIEPEVTARNRSLPGVQVSLTFSSPNKSELALPVPEYHPNAQVSLIEPLQLVTPRGETLLHSDASTKALIMQLLARRARQQSTALFDLGFGDSDRRRFEYFVSAVVQCNGLSVVIAWHTMAGDDAVDRAKAIIGRQKRAFRLLLANYSGELILISNTANRAGDISPSIDSVLADTSLDDTLCDPYATRIVSNPFTLLDIEHAVNTSYIRNGFAHHAEDAGFFLGTITLLNGDDASHFFSLSRNLASPSSSNVYRWAFALRVAFAVVPKPPRDRRLHVVCLNNTIKPVLHRLRDELGKGVTYSMQMSYDVPTEQEWNLWIQQNEDVIFVADVHASGTLLNGVTQVAAACGTRVLAVVCLVDASDDEGVKQSAPIHKAYSHPGFSLCRFRPTNIESGLWTYDVDPVSFTPVKRGSVSSVTGLVARMNETVALIGNSRFALCGHIVDGTRHMGAYINTGRLVVEQPDEVEALLRRVIKERLTGEAWSRFSPDLILFPSSVARIATLGSEHGPGKGSKFAESLGAYISVLKRIWPSAQPREIPRSYDAIGRAKCAQSSAQDLVSEFPHRVRHVVIADDGMWRGTTAIALSNIARAIGAKQIAIIPLIARMSPDELRYWEGIEHLAPGEDAEPIQVRHIFPLFLPLSYHEEGDCPYCQTMHRLQDKVQSNAFGVRVPGSIRKELKHISSRGPEQHFSAEYISTWLTVRGLSEMATESQECLGLLRRLVLSTISSEARSAILRLFLDEWNILGRYRLRRSIEGYIFTHATSAATESNVSEADRIVALSLIRSRFPAAYPGAISEMGAYVVSSDTLLERVLFHCYTLASHSNHSAKAVAAIKKMCSLPDVQRVVAEASPERRDVLMTVLKACQTMAWSLIPSLPPGLSVIDAARQLLSLYTDANPQNFQLRHSLDAELVTISSAGETNVKNWAANTHQQVLSGWITAYKPLIEQHILPQLRIVGPALAESAAEDQPLEASALNYLTIRPDSRRDAGLIADLAFIETALGSLVDGYIATVILDPLKAAAQRVRRHVISGECILLRELHKLKDLSPLQCIDMLKMTVEVRLRHLMPIVETGETWQILAENARKVFVPRWLVKKMCDHVVDNLARYAFEFRISASTSKVLIKITASEMVDIDGETTFVIRVYNNGAELIEPVVEGIGASQLRDWLKEFGAQYRSPQKATETGYSVEHGFSLKVW
jgi:adenine/guanine phosphoribosyltransferase-like PRPP-binding protein